MIVLKPFNGIYKKVPEYGYIPTPVLWMLCRPVLPDDYPVGRSKIHLVAVFYAESLEEWLDVAERSVDSPFSERVRVSLGAEQDLFVADVSGPYISVGEIEPLVGGESVDSLTLGSF